MTGKRRFTAEFKAKVVLEILAGEKSLAQASREYGITAAVGGGLTLSLAGALPGRADFGAHGI